jgi:hypothetical protein
MGIYKDIIEKKATIAVIGLGYVGLPIALAFAKKVKVIGFDINAERVDLMKKGIDPSNELTKADYEWSILEMYDQVIRNEKGGEIAKLWAMQDLPNEQWIKSRVGDEFMRFREILKKDAEARALKDLKSNKRIRFKSLSEVLNKIPWVSKINTLLKMLEIARFRQSGEIHQCMYDSFSLGEVLKKAGFNNIKVVDAYNSNIPNWQKYQWLDIENGKIRKPDSLFIEAIK